MTQEDKQLLLVDLCARLPYGVQCEIGGLKFGPYTLGGSPRDVEDLMEGVFKPYLRPIESMTEEEEKEINKFLGYRKEINGFGDICCLGWNGDVFVDLDKIYGYLDWLNEHHFDYRGLIEKGLALEAPEGMYKTE